MDQHATTKETTAAEARVSAAHLTEFAARVFIAAGLPQSDAHTIADLMVEADLRGSDINAKPNIRLISDRVSAALIDGDNGMGHLVMRRAAMLAIEKAKATGVGWVGAR